MLLALLVSIEREKEVANYDGLSPQSFFRKSMRMREGPPKKTERERFFLGRCRLLRRRCMETTLKGTKKFPPPSFFDVKAKDPPSPLFSAARETGDIYFPPPPPLPPPPLRRIMREKRSQDEEESLPLHASCIIASSSS